jgi:hypothetical protein
LFHAPEKLEYLDQESHALWMHLEIFCRAQVLDLLFNILAHVLEFLSKRVLHAWISNRNFEFHNDLNPDENS